MAKKKSKTAEEPVEEICDDEDEDNGLTYTKRYNVSRFQPEKSYGGSRCYKDFYETNTLSDAKKEAERVFKDENIEVVIWDRDKWCLEPIRYIPEVKEDSDESKTSKPRPKHPRRTGKRS